MMNLLWFELDDDKVKVKANALILIAASREKRNNTESREINHAEDLVDFLVEHFLYSTRYFSATHRVCFSAYVSIVVVVAVFDI